MPVRVLDTDSVEIDLILEFFNPAEGPNSGWVHVSYTVHRPNRRNVITAVRSPDGKTQYLPGLVTA